MLRQGRSIPFRVAQAGCLSLSLTLLGGGCSSSGGDDTLISSFLADLAPPTPGQAARDVFDTYDADKRRNALALLAAAPFGGETPYVRAYRLLIDDPDATVRGAAVKALGIHGTVEDVELLVPRLRDEAAYVRWEAAKALQRIHNPVAAQPLMEAVRNDVDADVRMAAADALGQYALPTVYDTLVGALTDTNYGVVDAASGSLRTLTGHDGGADPARWLAWSKDRRGNLFAGQQRYAYQDYQKPPGLIRKVLPFGDDDTEAPKATPVGLSGKTGSNG